MGRVGVERWLGEGEGWVGRGGEVVRGGGGMGRGGVEREEAVWKVGGVESWV